MANYKYSKNNANAFANIEPHVYGAPVPEKGKFKPLGNLDDLLVEGQAYENNGFSELINLEDYKVASIPLNGVKAGTFPKAGNGFIAARTGRSASNETDTEPTRISLKRTNNKLSLSNGSYPINYFKNKYELDRVPTKIGFILVGAGGGGGGCSRYDPAKEGNRNQIDCPGSGGGAGGVVYGVLDFDKIGEQELIISLGTGGFGGLNTNQNPAKKQTAYGSDGYNGGASSIAIKYINDTYINIATANGGSHGNVGRPDFNVAGGNGGNGSIHEGYKLWFPFIKILQGGKGCDATKTNPTAPAWNQVITFAASSVLDYQTIISNPALPATPDNKTPPVYGNFSVPGGNSYGCGSSNLTLQGPGGGGAATGSAGGNAGTGAGGYFAIFY